MRFCRVLVQPDKGKQFVSTLTQISADRVAFRGDQMLPVGMSCDLRVIIPPKVEKMPSTTAELKAEVGEVVFSDGYIRLECIVTSLGNGTQHLVDA